MASLLQRVFGKSATEAPAPVAGTPTKGMRWNPDRGLVPLGGAPDIHAKPRPVRHLLEPEKLVGRRAQLDKTATALLEPAPVELYGPYGVGKSTLVQHVGVAAESRDGVALVSRDGRSLDELCAEIFKAFFTSSPPIVAGTVDQLAPHLGDLQAILLLDDADMDQNELRRLRSAVPQSRLLLVSEDPQALTGVQSIPLGGLPVEEAMEFLASILGPEHELGVEAERLCERLGGHPRALALAAKELLRGGVSNVLEDAYRVADQAFEMTVVQKRSPREQRVLALLAFLDAPVSVETIARITGLSDAAELVKNLEAVGLVAAQSPTYGLTISSRAIELTEADALELPGAALQGFADWATQARNDLELLRLEARAAVTALTRAGGAFPADALRLALGIEHELSRSGRWDAWRVVLESALAAATRLGDHEAMAFVLHQLGARALCLGDVAGALESLDRAVVEAQRVGANAAVERSREARAQAQAEMFGADGSRVLQPAPRGGPLAKAATELEAAPGPFRLLGDHPYAHREDPLGFDVVADELATLIVSSGGSTPLTLAIEGASGVGKSSLMQRLEAQLGPGIKSLRFSPGAAADDALDGLVTTVLAGLDAGLLRGALQTRRLIGRVRSALLMVGGWLHVADPATYVWRRLVHDPRGRLEVLNVASEAVAMWRRAGHGADDRLLCVFVHDLDRCTPANVRQVFDAIKLYLGAPGLVFVLGYDPEVLGQALLEDAGADPPTTARDELERIVQTSYRIPQPTDEMAERLLDRYLDDSGTAQLFDLTVRAVVIERNGRNPRRIKRFINRFVLEYRLDPDWARLGAGRLVRGLILQLYFPEFARLLGGAWSRDPLEEFGDYAAARRTLTRRVAPAAAQEWDEVNRVLATYALDPVDPEDPAEHEDALRRLEQQVPDAFPRLVREPEFLALAVTLAQDSDWPALRDKLERRRRSPAPPGGDDPTAGAVAAASLEGAELLWIDPDRDRHLRLAAAFAHAGAGVYFALDGDDARRRMAERAGPFDLVISDVARAEDPVAGFDDVAGLLQDSPQVPVVFFTPRVTPALRARARQQGGPMTGDPGELLELVAARVGTRVRQAAPPETRGARPVPAVVARAES